MTQPKNPAARRNAVFKLKQREPKAHSPFGGRSLSASPPPSAPFPSAVRRRLHSSPQESATTPPATRTTRDPAHATNEGHVTIRSHCELHVEPITKKPFIPSVTTNMHTIAFRWWLGCFVAKNSIGENHHGGGRRTDGVRKLKAHFQVAQLRWRLLRVRAGGTVG